MSRGVYYPACRAVVQVVLEDFGGLGSFLRPLAIPVIPVEASVTYNSYNAADTWSMTFLAKDLPITADQIKAAAVELYLYNRRGMEEEPVSLTKGFDQDLFLGGPEVEPSIVGLVDEAEEELSDDEQLFHLSGRDYTALFLDKQYVQETPETTKGVKAGIPRKIPVGRRLDDTLKTMISEVPGTRDFAGQEIIKLKVVNKFGSFGLPVVGAGDIAANKRGIPVKDGASYWEAMQQVAVRHGYKLFVDGVNVVLTDDDNWKDARKGVAKMAWGRNLTSLSMTRKLGKERTPRIRINSYDDSTLGPCCAIYPPERTGGKSALGGSGTVRDEILDFRVAGVRSRVILERIAKETFLQLSRGELEIKISTSSLEDLEGTSIIRPRAGDAMSIDFDPAHTEEINSLPSVGDRVAFLLDRGFSPQVASAIANNLDKVKSLRTPLRIRDATVNWSLDSGISISASLHQFVNVAEEEP